MRENASTMSEHLVETPERTAEAAPVGIPPKPWGISAVLLALTAPLLLWGSSLAIAIAQGTPEDLSGGEIVASLVLQIFILDGVFIAAPAAFCLWRYRLGWADLGLRPFHSGLWWLPLTAAAGAWVAMYVYSIVLYLVGAEGAAPRQEDIDQLFESRAVLPLTALATLVVAPLAEELFFRGFVFPGLIRPLGLVPAMAISGFVFAVFHVTGSDSAGLVLPFGLIGMLFAWVYYRTGSLWPSIGTHFLFNLVSFIILASMAGGSG